MSLILEALRKSEAERRRGQAPDLLAEPVPVKRPSHTTLPRWWPWAAAALAVLIVGWLARGAFTSNPDATEVESQATVAQAEQVAAAREEDAATATQVPAPVAAPNAAPTAATNVAPPPVTTPPAKTPPAAPAVPAEATAPAAARKADIAPPAMVPAPVIATPTPPASATAPAPAPSPPQTFTSPDAPLRLSELTAEERQQLPPLKISMHMWAPEPAQRFVIIDGNRMIEGDRIGSAVIETITAEGVTLAWQGRRIQLPIR